jgi:hypothetical protein
MRLPETMRFNSHLGWDVAPGSELEAHLVRRERKLLGPAGSAIVFDGAKLLHRGGMVENGDRLALQVVFSDQTLRSRVFKRLTRAVA